MSRLREELMARKRYLENAMKIANASILKSSKLSGNNVFGSIHARKHRKGYQYYLKNADGIRYLKTSEAETARIIVQNEYDNKVLNVAKEEYKRIEKMLALYDDKIFEDIYGAMPAGKRRLINPITITDEEYLIQWKNQKYEPLWFAEDAPDYYSVKGERMRSKSEVIIANTLTTLNIDYLYEKPLKLNNMGIVHPDFTILDLQERKEIYWEHLGMLDDQEYRDNAIKKIRCYENNGYYLGDRLIITEESINCPLDIRLIEKRIKFVLKIK